MIEFTNDDGARIMLNLNSIVSVEEDEDNEATIISTADNSYTVKRAYDDVSAEIVRARAGFANFQQN